MKDYERINLLKHRVMEAERKFSKWRAFTGQAEENLKNFETYTEVQRQSFIDEVKACEETQAQCYEFLQNAEKALQEAEGTIKKKRTPKPKPKPKPELNVLEEEIEIIKDVKAIVNDKFHELIEGKERCPECGELFTKGGAFYNHYKSHFNGD